MSTFIAGEIFRSRGGLRDKFGPARSILVTQQHWRQIGNGPVSTGNPTIGIAPRLLSLCSSR
jgi:hypothetical protein